MIGVEDFVAVHDRHEVFGIGEIDDIVSVTGQHDYCLYPVSAYFVIQNFI